MSRLEILMLATCSIVGGTLGYAIDDMWTGLVFAGVSCVAMSAAVGRNESE